MFAIKPRDPAIPGDPHEPVRGKQQPGLGEADPERVVMQRQQQIKQRIAGLCKGERQRRVARISVGLAQIGACSRRWRLPARSCSTQRLVEVADQVVGGFEADRQAHDIRAGAGGEALLV